MASESLLAGGSFCRLKQNVVASLEWPEDTVPLPQLNRALQQGTNSGGTLSYRVPCSKIIEFAVSFLIFLPILSLAIDG